MYLMYVDESGDCGLDKSPTNYFVLSGLTVHESRWKDLLDHILNFRRNMKSVYGLPIRTEIHASEYIRSSPYPGIQKFQRLAILRNYLDELAKIDGAVPDNSKKGLLWVSCARAVSASINKIDC